MFFSNKQDLVDNDSEKNCLKNVRYKIKNGYDLTADNISRIAAPALTAPKIEKLDFMQWAILTRNENNVRLLSRYFALWEYLSYMETLSIDVQTKMTPLVHEVINEQRPGLLASLSANQAKKTNNTHTNSNASARSFIDAKPAKKGHYPLPSSNNNNADYRPPTP